METIRLVRPSVIYREEIESFKAELVAAGDSFDGCSSLN